MQRNKTLKLLFIEKLCTPICDLLGCQYPVVLAGMGGISRHELVSAVTNAGGYGFLGMVREAPEFIRQEIHAVRERTNFEFGVNIIPSATNPDLLDKQIEVCITEKIASVCLFWDVYPDIIKRFRDAGIIVLHQVGSVEDAIQAEKAGTQALIAQGIEAGGHVRGKSSVKNLLPMILRATELPVLSAGGFATGKDLLDQISAGADGIVMGTAFLATHESFAHEFHKEKIISSNVSDTLVTEKFQINWPPGAKTRVLKNSVTNEKLIKTSDNIVIGEDQGRPIYLFSTDSPLRSTTGNLEAMALYAGCGVGKIKTIEPASIRIQNILEEAGHYLKITTKQTDRGFSRKQFYSDPCYMEEINNSSMGFTSTDEITSLLVELYIIIRRIARISLLSSIEIKKTSYLTYFRTLYKSNIRWVKVIGGWVGKYENLTNQKSILLCKNVLKIKDIKERFDFINEQQIKIINIIKSIQTRISDGQLQDDLQDILTCQLTSNSITKKFVMKKLSTEYDN